MINNREHIARQAQHFEPDPGSVTPSYPSAEVRRQARHMQRYSLRPQASEWVIRCAVVALVLSCAWAVTIPFYAPIEMPAYCGTC